MHVDRYTKLVLSIVAVCLIWLSIGGPSLLTTTHAQSNDAVVVIRGWVASKGTVHALAPSGGSGGNGLPVDVVWGGH